MGELATINRAPVVPVFSMSDMERVANAIAQGGLFGSKDPFAVLTLCMLAQAEGQHPAVVFRDYHIINGKPAKKAEAMQRDFLAAGGRIEWLENTDDRCAAVFSHPAGGTATIDWDAKRVAQAQLGSNAMHKKYPRQMLRSRVISEGVRTVFPGATSGLYESGEVQDMTEQSAPVTPQPMRARDLKPAVKAIEAPAIDKAVVWADETIAAINAAQSIADLADVDARSVKAMTKLATDRPDLHEAVKVAMTTRERSLSEDAAYAEVADTDA
jgi:hypothetical protein